METFGERLKYLREQVKGITQQNLADSFGVKRQSIANWEAGKNEASYKDTIKLAEYFGVTIDWLMKGGDLAINQEPVVVTQKSRSIASEIWEELRTGYENQIAEYRRREEWYQEQLGKQLVA